MLFMKLFIACTALLMSLLSSSVIAKGTYYTTSQILGDVFQQVPSANKVLWLNNDHRDEANRHLNHKLRQARIKYWEEDDRRFWMISEIGKEKPITFGVVTNDGVIERMEVLAFREVRGDEIRLPAYTAQYNRQTLTSRYQLEKPVDGISGATYSVRSMKKVAKLALLFDRWVTGG